VLCGVGVVSCGGVAGAGSGAGVVSVGAALVGGVTGTGAGVGAAAVLEAGAPGFREE
jgi:hypothetical protein